MEYDRRVPGGAASSELQDELEYRRDEAGGGDQVHRLSGLDSSRGHNDNRRSILEEKVKIFTKKVRISQNIFTFAAPFYRRTIMGVMDRGCCSSKAQTN